MPDLTPKLRFKCPRCSTPGEMQMPDGEIVTGRLASVAVWPTAQYTCPRCLDVLVTVLRNISHAGLVWTLADVKALPSSGQAPTAATRGGPEAAGGL